MKTLLGRGTCVMVAFLVGCSATPPASQSPLETRLSTPSAIATTPSPGPTASALPTDTHTPTPTRKPPSTPWPTAPHNEYAPAAPIVVGPMGNSGWLVIAVEGPDEQGWAVRWSPDGSYFLLERPRYGGTAELYTSDGALISEFDDVSHVIWIDDARFLLIPNNVGEDEPNHGRLVSVDGGSVADVDLPPGLGPSNNHGAVALIQLNEFYTGECDPWGCPLPSYRVWSESATSRAHDGYPVAWSADGSRLFVLHVAHESEPPIGAPGSMEIRGWLEVLAWPGLRSVARFPDTWVVDDWPTLDPGDRFLTFISHRRDTDFLNVVDVRSGHISRWEIGTSRFAWAAEARLIVGPQLMDPENHYDSSGEIATGIPRRGSATVYDARGDEEGSWPDVGQQVASAPSASVVVFSDERWTDARSFITLLRGDVRSELEPLPLDGYINYCPTPDVAPSGAALTVYCSFRERYGNDQHAVFLHQL